MSVFVWLNGPVLDPLPQVTDARDLVAVHTTTADGNSSSISYPDYWDWQTQSRSLSMLVAHRQERLTLGPEDQPVWAVFSSANYFDALGLRPALGRFFLPSESAPEARPGTGRVVVLGNGLWKRQFGGRRDVIGSTIRLSDVPFTVIGVAPAGFTGTTVGYRYDVWVPITGAQGVHRQRGRGNALLVIAQLALALVATTSAGLLLRSPSSLHDVDPGFSAPEQVLVAETDVAPARYTRSVATQTANGVLPRVRTLPNVRSAAIAMNLPSPRCSSASRRTIQRRSCWRH